MMRRSAGRYFSRGSSATLPSVVTTRPMVACSRMTRRVPVSAAWSKGTAWSNQGLLTNRGALFSSCPRAPSTIYPTQSISRARKLPPAFRSMLTAFSGINFGSVVMIVRPAADWGSSSLARARCASFLMRGSSISSAKRLMKLLLPLRTGPTTPI